MFCVSQDDSDAEKKKKKKKEKKKKKKHKKQKKAKHHDADDKQVRVQAATLHYYEVLFMLIPGSLFNFLPIRSPKTRKSRTWSWSVVCASEP